MLKPDIDPFIVGHVRRLRPNASDELIELVDWFLNDCSIEEAVRKLEELVPRLRSDP